MQTTSNYMQIGQTTGCGDVKKVGVETVIKK
jgi:hypothetical protein